MSGIYSRTWYDDTCVSPSEQSTQQIQNKNFEFCIIGGGLAGLSCAYHLAKMGASVVLLEKSAIGAGASGRNG
ncbi:MAG: FAD-binding oxidoreductase, partial [Rhodobacteraceae bacterium]|nr:FAD-binding oxidoreductase [Paracoccaceae bacterium]